MDKSKVKKTESFASIFGDDFDKSPPDNKEGATELKLEQLIPFHDHPLNYMRVNDSRKWLKVSRTMVLLFQLSCRRKA